MDRLHLVFYIEPLPRSSRSSCGRWPQLCPIPAPTPAPCPALRDSHASNDTYLFLSAQAKNAYQSANPPSQIVRNHLFTRHFRVLRVTESLTQTEEAAFSIALGKKSQPLPTAPAQNFYRQSTSKFSDTACCPREKPFKIKVSRSQEGKTNSNPQSPWPGSHTGRSVRCGLRTNVGWRPRNGRGTELAGGRHRSQRDRKAPWQWLSHPQKPC